MRLQLVGKVVSTATAKTAKVKVDRLVRHPLYDRVLRQSKNYLVHDEHAKATVGDTVRIEECRPISKRKTFQMIEIVKEAPKFVNPDAAVEAPAPQPS